MSYRFTGTPHSWRGRAGWISSSVAAHALLIAAVLHSTPAPGSPWRGERHAHESVTFITPSAHARMVLPLEYAPPPRHAAAPGSAAPRVARRAAPATHFRDIFPTRSALDGLRMLTASLGSAPPVAVETAALSPGGDLTTLAARASDFDDDAGSYLRKMLARAYASARPGVTYAESAVDRAAAPLRENPTPRYPQALQAAGVEATLDVRFVVDSTGRVDAHSLSFPHDAHRLFVASIRAALLRSRYFPAELGGQRVRQLVQQRFVFMLQR